MQAVRTLDDMVKVHYRELSGTEDRVKMVYRASVELKKEQPPEVTFRETLQHNRAKDAVLGATTVGPHRDDLLFLIVAGDIRENVKPALALLLDRVKAEAISKNEFLDGTN